jgi:malonyl CoA-acyl carrier protein transacylase
MGAELFDTVKEFAEVERDIDGLLGYSVRELCLHDSHGRLTQTAFTQPALYVVNALHYFAALSAGKRPQLVAGHSLGEYNALLAAGVFDFLTGLKLVHKRGELMSAVSNGGMAAVIGITGDRLMQLLREHELTGLDVANFNSPTQTVISGPLTDIEQARPLLESAGVEMFVPLPVSGAFHSRYMLPAATEFARFLAPFTLNEPQLPVIANVTARPYPSGSGAAPIKELLAKQIHSPVQWTATMSYLIGRGTDNFHEMGPGSVLTRLAEQIKNR